MENKDYWYAGGVPAEVESALNSWVSENVCQAIKESWEDPGNQGWIEKSEEHGELIVKLCGPEKPSRPGHSFTINLDLGRMLEDYSELSYCRGRSGRSAAQQEEIQERAEMLRRLAETAQSLAAELEAEAGR